MRLTRCFFDVATKPLAAMSLSSKTFDGVEIKGPVPEPFPEILSPDALRFVARLQREFNARRKELLERRERRQAEIDQGKKPGFLPETAHIREGNWQVAPLPHNIHGRPLGTNGPTCRHIWVKLLHTGAKVFMADFEDANAPT